MIRVTLEGTSPPTAERWAAFGWTRYDSVYGSSPAPDRWRFDVQTESTELGSSGQPFPIDMLRHDRCWPFRVEDAQAIVRSLVGREQVDGHTLPNERRGLVLRLASSLVPRQSR